GASTLVTFKKEGYEDYYTTIRKDKKLNIGALISGLLLVYPLFWILGYAEAYSYDLEKAEISTRPVAVAEPEKTEVAARVAPVKDLPDSIDLPKSTRVENLLSEGQIDKAVEYANDQEGAFQAGCYYAIAQYYLDNNDLQASEDFFNRSGKISEGNVRIAESLMRGEIVDSVVVRDKMVMPEIPEMRLTAEDEHVFITIDSIVRTPTRPQDLANALEATNNTLRSWPIGNSDHVLVYFSRTIKKELNLTSEELSRANVSLLSDQAHKSYTIILERGSNYVNIPDGGRLWFNPDLPIYQAISNSEKYNGVIINYSYMMFYMPVNSTPVQLNYLYNYKNDANDKKTTTGTLTINLTQ
ncbi:MAG: hypothetical protein JXN10_03060, partial [Clostridia bacterium]|nr:hypothetical protein [Clostridia bacterium]